MLFEHLLMHPATLASICRLPAQPLCEQVSPLFHETMTLELSEAKQEPAKTQRAKHRTKNCPQVLSSMLDTPSDALRCVFPLTVALSSSRVLHSTLHTACTLT
jgi:hypothetical protein